MDLAEDGSSGMVQPPPLDPLGGLEVVIEDSFTVGRLKSVPSRRIRRGKNLFDESLEIQEFDKSALQAAQEKRSTAVDPKEVLDSSEIFIDVGGLSTKLPSIDGENMANEEERKAHEAAVAAAAEATRKEEKMEALRKRAEEALARRKANKKSH